MPVAAYDEIADWYADWVGGLHNSYSERVADVLQRLVPPGDGRTCLDIGCGTGARAGVLRNLGWRPVGVDLSTGQLRHARRVLPVAAADAAALPIATGSVDLAVSILTHTDLPDYPRVIGEAARVIRSGGRFVHVGIHPCFTGAFADRSDPARIIVDGGYHRRERRWDSFTTQGVRNRVGAWHLPLADLLNAFRAAGLEIVDTVEAGPEDGVPDVFAVAAVSSRRPSAT
ncbi:methyltransferase domain-containing protein [Hamadaea sp. NPDC050747]|uniref:class I SAM-dependent methyltransferase n=1 Tax=Hamadaea sp. NPDC050747 TaxID=3155789 RepID=UPI0033D19C91